MDYLIQRLLNEAQVNELAKEIEKESSAWLDGKYTAGSYAAKVKNNFQLDRKSQTSQNACDYVIKKIILDPLLKSFSLPNLVHGLMFTKSEPNCSPFPILINQASYSASL